MPEKGKNNAVKIIILLGVVIRLIIAPFAANFGDCFNWYGFARLAINDYPHLYNSVNLVPLSNAFYSYPPLWAIVLGVCLSPLFLFKITGISLTLFFIKLPVILTGIFLAKKIWDFTKSAKIVAFYYLSPLMIFLEAIWGAFDILTAALVFVSYWCAKKERFVISALMLSMAAAFKIWPLLIFPGMVIYLLKERKIKDAFLFAGIFFVSFIFFLCPFIFTDPSGLLKNTLFHHGARGINWHMSIWSIWYWLSAHNIVKMEWLYYAGSRIFLPNLIFYTMILLMYYIWTRNKKNLVLNIYIFPLLIFLVFSPWITPSYFAWIFVLLALISVNSDVLSKSDYLLLNILPIISELCANSRYATSGGRFFSLNLMANPVLAAVFFSTTACLYFYIWLKISVRLLRKKDEIDFIAENHKKPDVFTLRETVFIVAVILILTGFFAVLPRPQRINLKNQIFPAYAKAAKNKFIFNNLGVLYGQSGYFKEAQWAFNEGIKEDVSYELSLINLAFLYAHQKEFKKAVEQLEEVIRVNPKNYPVYEKIIFCCLAQEKPDKQKAGIYYNRALALGIAIPEQVIVLMKD